MSSLLIVFGLLAGIVVGSVLLFGGLVHFWLGDVRAAIQQITETIEPRSAAAFEMEVNVAETALAVVRYLHSPKPEVIARFHDDANDFWEFHERYRTLGISTAERSLADEIKVEFGALQELGRSIIAAKDEQVAEINRIIELIVEIDELTEGMALSFDSGSYGTAGPVLMRWFRETMREIESDIVVEGRPAFEQSAARVRRLALCIRAGLSRLAALALTSRQAGMMADFTESLSDLEARLIRFAELERALVRDFARLIKLRESLDARLDEEIQTLTTHGMTLARETVRDDVVVAQGGAVVLGVSLLAVVLLAILLLATTVVVPIKRLAVFAGNLGRGQLNLRLQSTRRDEIGVLARALDDMARNLEDAQGRLVESNLDLEAKVSRRTEELREVNRNLETELTAKQAVVCELQEKTRQAEAASRAKTAFLANMSHEFRTPLNGILGLAEMIDMKMHGELGNARYEEYVHDILQSGRGLLRHFNDVLEVSSIEFGEQKIRMEPVDVRAIVDRALSVHLDTADSRSIVVDKKLPEGLPHARADASRLEQVLCNLLDNAIKFSPEQSRITLSAYSDDDRQIAIEVADQGLGMTNEQLETALEFFGSVDPSRASRDRGLGLGLPLSRRLVEMQDGTMAIATTPGHGTVVTVRLSRQAGDTVPAEASRRRVG